MFVKGRLLIVFLLALFVLELPVMAQKKKKSKKSPPEQDILLKSPVDEIFKFPNVNRIPYYYDKKKLDDIQKYETAKNWKKLHEALGDYIKNFGIQNFYKDTRLLWQYAKLTELYGNMDDALKLYRLVLKHHHDQVELKKLEIYYDSITSKDKVKYVPVDYYYELIQYRNEVDTLHPPRGWKLNMGHLINSEYSDYGPALSPSNNILLFTSKRNIVKMPMGDIQNEDIFWSDFQYGIWGEATPLKELNTSYNEGSVCLSNDGETLYFARCDAPDSYGNCDLYVAHLMADSTWGEVKNLGPKVNSKSWDSHPALSHNDDTLYFASDRIGGFGLSDIYYSVKDKNGKWGPAQNAGPVINTRRNDVSPFYHPKYEVLYFSSNGQNLNFGEFDIYKSYKKNGYWTEPKNIGPLVNGPGSEFYFTIDSESKNLYYARSIENNLKNLDLYSFPLPMEAQPLATTKLTGSLTDSLTGNPFQRGIVSIIDLTNGFEVAPQYLTREGTFSFDLINNSKYLLIIQGDAFFRIEEIFVLDGDTELNMITDAITSRMEFKSIEFDNASAELKPGMYRDLDKISDFLLDNPDFKLKISGHTDSDGTDEYNKKLSKERAQAIADYIIYFGHIPAARIETFGYGSSKPIVEEKTEADKALNRRVEFELYRPSKTELDKMQKQIEEEEDDNW